MMEMEGSRTGGAKKGSRRKSRRASALLEEKVRNARCRCCRPGRGYDDLRHASLPYLTLPHDISSNALQLAVYCGDELEGALYRSHFIVCGSMNQALQHCIDLRTTFLFSAAGRQRDPERDRFKRNWCAEFHPRGERKCCLGGMVFILAQF